MLYKTTTKYVQAWFFEPQENKRLDMPRWLQDAILSGDILTKAPGHLYLVKNSTDVEPGEWIIKDTNGILEWMYNEDFKSTYDLAPQLSHE